MIISLVCWGASTCLVSSRPLTRVPCLVLPYTQQGPQKECKMRTRKKECSQDPTQLLLLYTRIQSPSAHAFLTCRFQAPTSICSYKFSLSEEEQQAWNTIPRCAACREGNQSVVKSLEGAFITVVLGSARGFVIIVVLLSCSSLHQVVQGFLSMWAALLAQYLKLIIPVFFPIPPDIFTDLQ